MLKKNIELWLWPIILAVLNLRLCSNFLSNPSSNFLYNLANVIKYSAVVIPVLVSVYFFMTRWKDRYLVFIIGAIVLAIVFKLQYAKLNYLALACAFCVYTPNETVRIYRRGLGLTFILGFLSGIAVHRLHSDIDNVFSFGFYNENQVGFILALLAILFTIKINQDQLDLNWNMYTVGFYALIFLIITFLFKDRTAEIMLTLYVLLLLVRKFFKVKFVQALIVILPLFLAFFSYWSAMNYWNSNFLALINKLSTSRLMMWNYYFNQHSLSLLGNNIVINKGWGIGYTPGQGMFDGSYAYSLFVQGLIFSFIIFIGLALANLKLLINKHYLLTVVMVVIEIAAFTENLPLSISFSFAPAFAFIAYIPMWASHDKEELNEE